MRSIALTTLCHGQCRGRIKSKLQWSWKLVFIVLELVNTKWFLISCFQLSDQPIKQSISQPIDRSSVLEYDRITPPRVVISLQLTDTRQRCCHCRNFLDDFWSQLWLWGSRAWSPTIQKIRFYLVSKKNLRILRLPPNHSLLVALCKGTITVAWTMPPYNGTINAIFYGSLRGSLRHVSGRILLRHTSVGWLMTSRLGGLASNFPINQE